MFYYFLLKNVVVKLFVCRCGFEMRKIKQLYIVLGTQQERLVLYERKALVLVFVEK